MIALNFNSNIEYDGEENFLVGSNFAGYTAIVLYYQNIARKRKVKKREKIEIVNGYGEISQYNNEDERSKNGRELKKIIGKN